MREEVMIKLAFCCVLIGVPLLYISSLYVEGGEFDLREDLVIGKVVGVRVGKVTKIFVEETRKVPVVVFDEIEVEKGAIVRITGEFRDGEFIAQEIKPHRIS